LLARAVRGPTRYRTASAVLLPHRISGDENIRKGEHQASWITRHSSMIRSRRVPDCPLPARIKKRQTVKSPSRICGACVAPPRPGPDPTALPMDVTAGGRPHSTAGHAMVDLTTHPMRSRQTRVARTPQEQDTCVAAGCLGYGRVDGTLTAHGHQTCQRAFSRQRAASAAIPIGVAGALVRRGSLGKAGHQMAPR
jgi:hypothetical protein